jgi:hypothetical protein
VPTADTGSIDPPADEPSPAPTSAGSRGQTPRPATDHRDIVRREPTAANDTAARAERRARARRALAARGRPSPWGRWLAVVLGSAVGAAVAAAVAVVWLGDSRPARSPAATAPAVPPPPTAPGPAPPVASTPSGPTPTPGRPRPRSRPAELPPRPPAGADAPAASPRAGGDDPADERRVLEQALHDWLEATRQRDIDTQMRFYPERVPVYYTWRDVPHGRVRSEKLKIFGDARVIDIDAGPPDIVPLADGEAMMRFRKRYRIEGPTMSRRGEVLQEMRWARTPDGWKIVVERDAAVLSR